MKYLIAFFILATVGAAKAETPRFNSIGCSEFLYTDRVTIHVNLETSSYVVTTEQPVLNRGRQKVQGSGRISRRPKVEGRYLVFTLYENSKVVGFLRAAHDSGRGSVSSDLDFKGYSAFDLHCHFGNR